MRVNELDVKILLATMAAILVAVGSLIVTDPRARTSKGVGIRGELDDSEKAFGLSCRTANEGTEYGTFPACTGASIRAALGLVRRPDSQHHDRVRPA